MTLQPGTQVGSYEILALIGAGGMGEVYKARDPKLNRLVAIKVLPAALAENPDFLARFAREAKAVAALSHPNVLGIFDLASEEGLTYAVMELLEGDSLRDKLKGGALPPKRAIEIALELAQGLGAAHARGIVHRDVKPENIFITREGRVKVLDFGLAKQLVPPRRSGAVQETEEMNLAAPATEAGLVLGTAGYMSPEQVRGEPADQRADIFAFGVVLFEMLSGHRPFHGDTPMHTMTAILDQEPPELTSGRGALPAGLDRLVGHCLEKRPEARFQSMPDLAYNLQNLSTLTSGARPGPALPARRRVLALAPWALLALVLATAAGLGLADRLHLGRALRLPTFTRLAHKPGTIESAFFGPDGRTVYFSERIQGGRPEIFVLHPGSAEPRPLGVKDALLVGVSPSGELAVLKGPRGYFGSQQRGLLAQVGSDGGALREIQESVVMAAWDGTGFATLTDLDRAKVRLEYAGKVVLEGNPGVTYLRFIRNSPDGELLAVAGADGYKTEIATYDRAGRRTVYFTKAGDAGGDTLTGMAWGPDGEIWFSEFLGDQTAVWSLTRGGARRLLWRGEGTKELMDVARDGRMLLADQQVRRGVLLQKAGEAQPRDVSIASATQAFGFSEDGRSLLLLESPVLDGGDAQDKTFLCDTETGNSVRVALGTGTTLSQDGRWISVQYTGFQPRDLDPAIAAAFREAGLEPKAALDANNPSPSLLFVPTGAGRPFAVALPKAVESLGYAWLTRDGRKFLLQATFGSVSSWCVMDRRGGAPAIVGPPGNGQALSGLSPLSPDGQFLITQQNMAFLIQPVAGGEPRPIRGMVPNERPTGWSQDQKAVFVRTVDLPVILTRLDLATGARKQVFSYMPGDASGLIHVRSVNTTPDARIFAVTYARELSNLYLTEGVK